jgi:eukaryotic-like serine/threonine-protein kinase
MDLQIGSTVGDYQVVGILGAGGMGKVYKVRNVISDRLEAMKVLLPDLTNAPELADRFLREIKVQASLVHPNIASLHTAVRQDNQLLMLMEFVDGVTLEQRMKDGPLQMAEAVDYIRQVLSALDYAHQHGVVHRDIKPANMMLTTSGVVKLMDFGIAKASSDHKLTMTGTTMGSLYYMSPEQIQGAANLDARADLYSVGVSLYELLTGKRPFDGDSQFAIMSAHLEKTPVPPITLDPRMPQGLNDVILMSVAKSPDARFQTAGAFRNALGAVVAPPAAQPVAPPPVQAAAPPATVTMPGKQPAAMPVAMPGPTAPAKSKRGVWMALGAIAAVAVLVAAVQFGPWKGGKAAGPTAAPVVTENPAPPPVTPPQPTPSQPAAEVPAVTQPAAQVPSIPQKPVDTPLTTPVKPRPSVASSQRPTVSQPQQQPTQQQPMQMPAQQPAQSAPQVSAPQPAAPPVDAGPSRAELQKMRESLALLNNRASSVRNSMDSLKRSQAAQGFNIGSQYTSPAGLMETYLNGANDALNARDLGAAKDFASKAERQIETLEKLLHL